MVEKFLVKEPSAAATSPLMAGYHMGTAPRVVLYVDFTGVDINALMSLTKPILLMTSLIYLLRSA